MNDNSQDKNAISRLVYLGANKKDSNEHENCGCCFGVMNNAGELELVPEPQDFDVVFIRNGMDGGADLAIYYHGEWHIKPLRGERGLRGYKGDTGQRGEKGKDGKDGNTGAIGEAGRMPNHRWDGAKLQFQLPNGSWGTFIDLKGEDGKDGKDGKAGARGLKPKHEWRDTELRFELPDATWGVYVDLRGTDGADGADGLPPEHEIDTGDSKIRFKNPNGSWGEWIYFGSTGVFNNVDPKCLVTDRTTQWDNKSDSHKLQLVIDKICGIVPNSTTIGVVLGGCGDDQNDGDFISAYSATPTIGIGTVLYSDLTLSTPYNGGNNTHVIKGGNISGRLQCKISTSGAISDALGCAVIPPLSRLIIGSTSPISNGGGFSGSITLEGGEPNEVIHLDASVHVQSGGQFYSVDIKLPVEIDVLDTMHLNRSGTVTLDSSGNFTGNYQITDHEATKLKVEITIASRESGEPMPSNKTTTIFHKVTVNP